MKNKIMGLLLIIALSAQLISTSFVSVDSFKNNKGRTFFGAIGLAFLFNLAYVYGSKAGKIKEKYKGDKTKDINDKINKEIKEATWAYNVYQKVKNNKWRAAIVSAPILYTVLAREGVINSENITNVVTKFTKDYSNIVIPGLIAGGVKILSDIPDGLKEGKDYVASFFPKSEEGKEKKVNT